MKILIMGLPGSGKTTLAKHLAPMLNAVWINADEARTQADDWDFTEQGRQRQALRMWTLAEEAVDRNRVVVADFICPNEETRQQFKADYTVWMDTIKESKFEDTNKMFVAPTKYNFRVTHKEANMWAYLIKQDIVDTLGNLGPHR
jgi:adenylylsulfate kinase|tara:strand:- start:9 stop:443 length:435 start_codon:yes stop_codon:yes gene_type:complete